MDITEAIPFLFMIMAFLWLIKADFFFILFGVAVYLFLIIFLFVSNPVESLFQIGDNIILNPITLVLFIVPFIAFGIIKFLQKILTKRRINKLLSIS